jgi:hypothetical protein
MFKKFLCWLWFHNWSKDINERNWQFHTGVSECMRCNKRKIIYQDVFTLTEKEKQLYENKQ